MQELQRFSSRTWFILVGALAVAVLLVFTAAAAIEPYDRKLFAHWSDLDGDGLDTREELLVELSLDRESRYWVCPYTGMVFTDPAELDVDHVVSLKTAWICGALFWTPERREQFANDPDNLLLVWGPANRSKGDKSPELWLPPNLKFWDDYITITKNIYDKYNLQCPNPDPTGKVEKIGEMRGVFPRRNHELILTEE